MQTDKQSTDGGTVPITRLYRFKAASYVDEGKTITYIATQRQETGTNKIHLFTTLIITIGSGWGSLLGFLWFLQAVECQE